MTGSVAGLAGLVVGWHAVDVGEPPRSPLYDAPPVVPAGDLASAHLRWRARVEADQLRLVAAHRRRPVWYPVPVLVGGGVLPVCGGDPTAWGRFTAVVALLAARAGTGRVRLVNLTRSVVFDPLRELVAAGAPAVVRSDHVSPGGSTLDLFGTTRLDPLAGLVAEVLRAGPRGKRALVAAGRHLTGPVTLTRLRASVTADRAGEIAELAGYGHDPTSRPVRIGRSGPTIRTVDIAGGGRHELARELLARSAARAFTAPTADRELLVVVGAEELSDDVLTAMVAAATGKSLVLVFGSPTPAAERVLGTAGHKVFLRVADGAVAARHTRDRTLVVNGTALAPGTTPRWTAPPGGDPAGLAARTLANGRALATTAALPAAAFEGLADDLALVVTERTTTLTNHDPRLLTSTRTAPTPWSPPGEPGADRH